MKFGVRSRKKDPTATPPYLSHFRLQKAPFSNGDASFFYADPERDQALNMLLHLAQYSEELLLVSGPEGSGKTKLLDQFLARAEENWKVCRFQAGDVSDAGQLFLFIAQCFGLDLGSAGGEPLDALKSHLDEMLTSQVPILVVDDAHTLSDDALEIVTRLADLTGEHGKLVRTVLASEPDILGRLRDKRFEAIPEPHTIELKPLSEDQTAAYIEHRLKAAGYSDGQPFGTKQIKRIQKASRGWPAEINRNAHEALVERMKAEKPSRFARRHLLLGAVALLLAAAVVLQWLWQGSLLTSEAPPESASPVAVAENVGDVPELQPAKPILRQVQADAPPPAHALTLRGGEALQVTCAGDDGNAAALPAPQISLAPSAVPQAIKLPAVPSESPTDGAAPAPPSESRTPSPESAATPAASAEPLPETGSAAVPFGLRISDILPDPVVGSSEPQMITLKGSGFSPETRVIVSWSGRSKLLPESRVRHLGPEELQFELNTGTSPATWVVQVSESGRDPSDPVRFEVVAPPPPGTVSAPREAEAPPSGEPAPVAAKQERPEVRAVEPDPVRGSWQLQTVTVRGARFTADSRVKVAWNGEYKEIPAARTEFVDSGTLRIRMTTGNRDDDWRLKVATAAGESEPLTFRVAGVGRTAKATPAKAGALQGLEWVRRQPAANMTLQLAVTRDPDGPEAFAREHGLKGELAAVPMKKQGETMYGLLMGSYADRSGADKAAAGLPPAVRQQGPWPRPFSDVRAELAAPAASGSGSRGEPWLWSQNPSRFTVQLAAASEQAALKSFLDGHRLSGVSSVYRTTRDGRPWFVLLYGNFADRAAAEAAVRELPAALRSSSPWIRTFAAIHEDLAGITR